MQRGIKRDRYLLLAIPLKKHSTIYKNHQQYLWHRKNDQPESKLNSANYDQENISHTHKYKRPPEQPFIFY
ncbi:hypothetical protein Maes01_00251 [Microbulbifer aestuariivivens]|uniref:Uncharacterized protein n=1 Tax=Microbulbifer aestuariivivens TaxID=1908308 RepID=A0ABP9WKI8_9GAMM